MIHPIKDVYSDGERPRLFTFHAFYFSYIALSRHTYRMSSGNYETNLHIDARRNSGENNMILYKRQCVLYRLGISNKLISIITPAV